MNYPAGCRIVRFSHYPAGYTIRCTPNLIFTVFHSRAFHYYLIVLIYSSQRASCYSLCFKCLCYCLGKYVNRLRGADKNIETFPCPTCRSEFSLKSNQDVADLASNYFIKNMLEIMAIERKAKKSTTCSRCQESAINHCTTCRIFMCQKCSESHDSWLAMKLSHNVLSVEELSNPKVK